MVILFTRDYPRYFLPRQFYCGDPSVIIAANPIDHKQWYPHLDLVFPAFILTSPQYANPEAW